ncbi:zinc-ribbon domain-containing protein [Pedobacter sp.]
MSIIFDFDYTNTTNYGTAQNQYCASCNAIKTWELIKKSKYFTLFSIPILPQSTKYWHQCTECKQGDFLSKKEFDAHKNIADINTDFANGTISLDEKEAQLNAAFLALEKMNAEKKEQALSESYKWLSIVALKTDAELLAVLEKQNDYQLDFIIAVEVEVTKRRLNK